MSFLSGKFILDEWMNRGLEDKSFNVNRKVAFTLAEVLITLGVIGVVASMTLPNVIQNYQKKQTVIKLKKAMNIINQAYQRSYQDNGNLENDMNAQDYYERYWKSYIKSPILCSSPDYCGYKKLYPYKYIDKNTYVGYELISDNYFAIKTIDGYILRFSAKSNCTNVGSHAHCKSIWIDINGSQRPNILGKDVFVLQRNNNKISYDTYCAYNLKTYVDDNCKSSGDCCARKIVNDNWKIADDYPW